MKAGLVVIAGITSVLISLPLIRTAGSTMRRSGAITIKKGDPLGAQLPDLSQARRKTASRPVAPVFPESTPACVDCAGTLPNAASVFARFDPVRRTGGDPVDLYSGNLKWNHPIVSLPGRSKLDVSLDLVYNSLVWTAANGAAWYDADRGFPAPGFQLGLPRIQGPVKQTPGGPAAYLLIAASGARVPLAQAADPHTFEATDGSLLQLVDAEPGVLTLRSADGTQSTFAQSGGEWHCTRVEDRNGNYLSAVYATNGRLRRIEDTVGRAIDFLYSRGHLTTIVQRDPRGDRTLATFGYEAIAVAAHRRVDALAHFGLRDGGRFDFEYDDFGRVSRIVRRAPDGHILSTVAYEFVATMPAASEPLPTAIRAWAEAFNGGTPLVTTIAIDREAGTGQAVMSDGSSVSETFGTSGQDRGLTQRRVELGPRGTSQTTLTTWQRSSNAPFGTVKREQVVSRVDDTQARLVSETAFNGLGLPDLVTQYRDTALVQRMRTTYVTAPAYLGRHILNLVERHDLEGPTGELSTTSYAYDLPGTVVDQPDQGPILHHDGQAYGPGRLEGRGLLSQTNRSGRRGPSGEPGSATSTQFLYNAAGSIVEISDSRGRRSVNSYEDAYSDGVNRHSFAYITSSSIDGKRTSVRFDAATGQRVRVENPDGQIHAMSYDEAGRLIARQNVTTGAGARRIFDESGTLVTTLTKRAGAKKEFAAYKVLDGAGLTRARAENTIASAGYTAAFIWRDAKGAPIRTTAPVAVNAQWVAQQDTVAPLSAVHATAVARAGEALSLFERRVSGLLDRAGGWLQPGVNAQEYCDPDYYGVDDCCYDPDNWFYGGEWGYDYYYTYSDVYDVLTWDEGCLEDPGFWGSVDWAFGPTDPQSNVDWQLWNSGYWDYIIDATWNGKGYSGRMDPAVFDWLLSDPNFANGILYGMHRSVGDNLHDFRSYNGYFGDGSLQIVIDRYTGNFWMDVDRFNPYQDVVNFFGHAFVEVLPHFFRKLCFWC